MEGCIIFQDVACDQVRRKGRFPGCNPESGLFIAIKGSQQKAPEGTSGWLRTAVSPYRASAAVYLHGADAAEGTDVKVLPLYPLFAVGKDREAQRAVGIPLKPDKGDAVLCRRRDHPHAVFVAQIGGDFVMSGMIFSMPAVRRSPSSRTGFPFGQGEVFKFLLMGDDVGVKTGAQPLEI